MYMCVFLATVYMLCTHLSAQLPRSLVASYMECVSANPRSRPNPSSLLSTLREHGGFLATPLVTIALRIEELQVRVQRVHAFVCVCVVCVCSKMFAVCVFANVCQMCVCLYFNLCQQYGHSG